MTAVWAAVGSGYADRVAQDSHTWGSDSHLFVGLDVHKATIAIAVAEQGRTGEMRYISNFPNNPASIITQLKRFVERYGSIECVYEAGPCVYTLYRRLLAAGIPCIVVAPSKLPLVKGWVKNDQRDAVALARLLRAGELVSIWVPDPVHEAMRDLVRGRQAASFDVRKARQRIQSYLLLRDRHFAGKPWSYRHTRWISDQQFEHRAMQIMLQGYVNALEQAESRRAELDANPRASSKLESRTEGYCTSGFARCGIGHGRCAGCRSRRHQPICFGTSKLIARGKKSQIAVRAIARELLGFVWAIARAQASHESPTIAA